MGSTLAFGGPQFGVVSLVLFARLCRSVAVEVKILLVLAQFFALVLNEAAGCALLKRCLPVGEL